MQYKPAQDFAWHVLSLQILRPPPPPPLRHPYKVGRLPESADIRQLNSGRLSLNERERTLPCCMAMAYSPRGRPIGFSPHWNLDCATFSDCRALSRRRKTSFLRGGLYAPCGVPTREVAMLKNDERCLSRSSYQAWTFHSPWLSCIRVPPNPSLRLPPSPLPILHLL